MSIHDLPAVNASLNGLSAIFLTAGFVFIRRKNKIAHRNCMVAAFVTSIFFLACYLTYHGYRYWVCTRADAIFGTRVVPADLPGHSADAHRSGRCHRADDFGDAEPRAAQRFELHKKIARWTWPLWMYVSVTGVVVYLLLYQIFPQK